MVQDLQGGLIRLRRCGRLEKELAVLALHEMAEHRHAAAGRGDGAIVGDGATAYREVAFQV